MTDSPAPDSQQILNATAHVPDHVVYRSFEAETLLLNLETGQYHGLNATGGRMIELIKEGSGQVAEAIDQLATECEVDASEIEHDLVSFCAQLSERGLIELSDPPGDPSVEG